MVSFSQRQQYTMALVAHAKRSARIFSPTVTLSIPFGIRLFSTDSNRFIRSFTRKEKVHDAAPCRLLSVQRISYNVRSCCRPWPKWTSLARIGNDDCTGYCSNFSNQFRGKKANKHSLLSLFHMETFIFSMVQRNYSDVQLLRHLRGNQLRCHIVHDFVRNIIVSILAIVSVAALAND